MMKQINFFWPLFFIFFLWIIFSSPYILKHKIPYPSDYQVNNFHPWNGYIQFLGPVKNNAMPDVIDQIYPWRNFTIEELKTGRLPLWNPYSFSGNPHLANYQSAVFSPFNFLFFIMPFIEGWSLLILLQPLLAGIFMYIFVKKLKISNIAALLSSISFMFCGFMVVWMEYGTLGWAIAFLPLSLLAIECYFEKSQVKMLLLLFLTIPLSFFSGHFQTSVYFLLFIICYVSFKILLTKKYKKGLTVFICLFLGILFCSVQLIPSIELYQQSVRSGIFRKTGGIPIQYLVTLFSPDFFGNPVTRNNWFGYYAEWASFIGVVPLFFSFVSLLKIKQKTILFFALIASISLLFSMDTPLSWLLVFLKIPVLSTSSPSRIIILTSFSLAILAGFGLDVLKENLLKNKYKQTLFPLAFLVIIFLLCIIFPFVSHMSADKRSIAYHNLVIPGLLFVAIIGILFSNILLRHPGNPAVAGASRISSWRFWTSQNDKKLLQISLFSIILLASFDSLHFAMKWMPFGKPSDVFPNLAVIEKMQQNVGFGRAFGNFGAYIDTYYHIPSIEGYDPLYSQQYGEFIQAARNGTYDNAERSIVRLNRSGKYTDRVLDLLGVTVIYHPVLDTNKSWAYPVWKDPDHFQKIFQDQRFALYRNTSALPHLSLFFQYETISDSKKLLQRFYSDGFDFRKTLLLEKNPVVKPGDGKGAVVIEKQKPQQLVARIQTTAPAFLFLSDTYYPGWKAFVDGKETTIFRADYAFRAISVPKGKHQIRFVYKPVSFQIGIAVSIVSLVSIGGLLFILKKKI